MPNQTNFSGAGSGSGAGRRPFHSQSSLSHQQAAADGVVLPRSARCLEVLEVVLLAIVEARRHIARHHRAAVPCQCQVASLSDTTTTQQVHCNRKTAGS